MPEKIINLQERVDENLASRPKAGSGNASKIPAEDPAPINWSSKIDREPPPRHWFVGEWLPPAPTLVSAGGGIGKSTLMQTMITALAFGRNFIGEVPKAVNVLMWNSEDDENELWRRQVPINQHFGLEVGDLQGKLHIVARRGLDNVVLDLVYGAPHFTPVLDRLREQVEDLKVDVLVLDNLAHLFGGREGDRHQTTLFVNAIAGMVTDRPFAPILVGHTARSEGSEYSGSAAWENACRARWYLGKSLPDAPEDDQDTDPDVLVLAKRKANYSAKDHIKMRYEGGLFVPENTGGLGLDPAARNRVADQVVLKSFDEIQRMGMTCSDSTSSPDFLPRKMIELKLAQGHGKTELKDAMNRLLVAGVFQRAKVGVYGNRSPKYGLIRAAGACTK